MSACGDGVCLDCGLHTCTPPLAVVLLDTLDDVERERDATRAEVERLRVSLDIVRAQRDDALRAVTVERAEVARLRAALREHAVRLSPMRGRTVCEACHGSWLPREPEQHAPGCLAALPEVGT